MISAEYSCHDILSFIESWLSENISTDQQCLEIPDSKFHPFRRDRSNKVGGGVLSNSLLEPQWLGAYEKKGEELTCLHFFKWSS
jgi:hypothetical protein